MPDGSGVLVLVIGPSGAGKDTLIDRARAAFVGRPATFARRIVTRPSSAAERHHSIDPRSFQEEAARGAFAFCWHAHGLDYAISRSIEPALASGQVVVCNVSRGIVRELRARYPRVFVVYVDAPLALRLGRIAGRGRPSERSDRARRDQDFLPNDADQVIGNDGPIEVASRAFNDAIAALLTDRDEALSEP